MLSLYHHRTTFTQIPKISLLLRPIQTDINFSTRKTGNSSYLGVDWNIAKYNGQSEIFNGVCSSCGNVYSFLVSNHSSMSRIFMKICKHREVRTRVSLVFLFVGITIVLTNVDMTLVRKLWVKSNCFLDEKPPLIFRRLSNKTAK